MDSRSEENLKGVHPDLVRVIRRAAILPTIPFIVIHGMRTVQEEAGMVAKGASQTIHSRHLPNEEGFACAVDVAAMVEGHVSWQQRFYEDIWAEVEQAANTLAVPVEWGGHWRTLKDWGHFQLPWQNYP